MKKLKDVLKNYNSINRNYNYTPGYKKQTESEKLAKEIYSLCSI